VQQIVHLDKKITAVSSDVAAGILKKEIKVLNELLEQLSDTVTQGEDRKNGERGKGVFASFLKRRKSRST